MEVILSVGFGRTVDVQNGKGGEVYDAACTVFRGFDGGSDEKSLRILGIIACEHTCVYVGTINVCMYVLCTYVLSTYVHMCYLCMYVCAICIICMYVHYACSVCTKFLMQAAPVLFSFILSVCNTRPIYIY